MKTVLRWIGIICSIAAVIPATIALNTYLSPWADRWSFEALAGEVIELKTRVLGNRLSDVQLRVYQNQREQTKYNPGAIPDWLLNERNQLEIERNNLQQELNTELSKRK